jgi:hypothetical protein
MSRYNDHESPKQAYGRADGSRPRRHKRPVLIGLAAITGLTLAPHVLPAPAAPSFTADLADAVVTPVPMPDAEHAWIQGVLTDQAGHALDNVNVEAWSNDPTDTEPVASNLTYAGDPADTRHQHGVYRLEVPADQPFRIIFSTVGGQEDGDLFRMQAYGQGRPIMARSASAQGRAATGATVSVAAAGRIIDLGTTQLVRQGTVASATTARVGVPKATARRRGVLVVRVTSRFVTNVTGKVVVKVSRKRVSRTLATSDHGKARIRLPKLKPGSYVVMVRFKGSNTVAPSKARPVRLTVRKR